MTLLNRTRLNVLLASLILLVGLAGCSLAGEPVPAGPIESGPLPGEEVQQVVPVTMPRAANGQVIFAAHCAACHGAEGKGDGQVASQLMQQGAKLPDFSDPATARAASPPQWFTTITLGTINSGGFMPPWQGTLTDSERWDVTYFLYSLSTTPDQLEQGKQIFADSCAECHGEDGSQDDILTDIGRIAKLSPADIATLLQGGDPNHQFADLGEDDLWAVTMFSRTFAYDPTLNQVAEQGGNDNVAPEPTSDNVNSNGNDNTQVAEAPGVTMVKGLVMTGDGKPVPAGTEVKIEGVTLDAAGSVTTFAEKTTTTDENGSYRFEGLSTEQTTGAYLVSATYQGVEFTNGAMIDPNTPVLDLPITVYEVTNDESVISLDAAHVVISQHPDSLLVVEVLVFNNSSDKVYQGAEAVAGGQHGSVSISLPPDAESVTFDEGTLGGRFVESGGKIYDTEQVLPGERSHSIIVQYILPMKGTREISLPMPYGANQVTVLGQGEATIRSSQLTAAGTAQISGQSYDQYTGQPIPKGGTLTITVAPPGLGSTLSGLALPLLVGIAALLVVGGGTFWVIRRRVEGEDLTPALAALTSEEQALIRQIADLDDAYDAGTVNRLEYEARRAELKARVAEGLQEE